MKIKKEIKIFEEGEKRNDGNFLFPPI